MEKELSDIEVKAKLVKIFMNKWIEYKYKTR